MKKNSIRPAWLSQIAVCITKLNLGVAGIPHLASKSVAGRLSIVMITIALVVGFSTEAIAGLMTECCVDCHVVHLWQDQTERKKASVEAYVNAIRGAERTYTDDSEKHLGKALQKEACEGCHSDTNSHAFAKSGLNAVPIVKNAEEPENPLAGGNFYYNSGQSHFKKAGGSCTSCHRDVRHHGTDHGYRFLGPDIKGIGDPLYEHGEGHNIYQSGDQYCIACHANFCGLENQKSSTGWVRHPTNMLLPMNGEYAGYELYRKDVPVSYPDPKKPERSTARVMCMSCHRPHGTPHPYLLRWDYSKIIASGGDNTTGCFACHTKKDTDV